MAKPQGVPSSVRFDHVAYLHHSNIDSVNFGLKIGALKMVIKDTEFFKRKIHCLKICLQISSK